MKVCVISGSPKGENSITYQTVLFLQRRFPDIQFTTLHVGQRIRSYRKDMEEAVKEIETAHVLLFCYPVYTFIAPSQLHEFISLLKESDVYLNGKYAAQISTSKHFYDTTAHEYIKENCLDMGLKYVGGLSADMSDLLKKKGQKEAYDFWKLVLWNIKHDIYDAPVSGVKRQLPVYECSLKNNKKREGKETVIVANLEKDDVSLKNMIDDFCAYYPYKTRVVNIAEYPFDGGCLGCFNCAATGKCIYKDGFDTFLRNEIQTGAAIIYAYTIKDHSMGYKMKMFDDRQFCNGHRTVTMGMPVGYIVNGCLSGEPNLKLIMEGRAQVGGNFPAGIANDRDGLMKLAKTLVYARKTKIKQPAMFLGVGGMKIFRDLIWEMQGLMKEDHRFYKKHGFYDFPQKHIGTVFGMKLVGAMVSNPKIQAKIGSKMTEGMLMPYKKIQ